MLFSLHQLFNWMLLFFTVKELKDKAGKQRENNKAWQTFFHQFFTELFFYTSRKRGRKKKQKIILYLPSLTNFSDSIYFLIVKEAPLGLKNEEKHKIIPYLLSLSLTFHTAFIFYGAGGTSRIKKGRKTKHNTLPSLSFPNFSHSIYLFFTLNKADSPLQEKQKAKKSPVAHFSLHPSIHPPYLP